MKFQINQTYSKSFLIDDEIVKQYALASKDNNPVHLDSEFAKTTIFKNRIAHGMLLGGLISSVLGNYFPGNGTIYLNQQLSFRKPVYLDEIVEIVIKIINVNEKGWLTLSTNCYVKNIIVIEGNALVIPPK